ncbi:MAG: hypothetical protein A2583_08035, partial [Bdellovibrionales bacterium RIFOXYD1_FULL_53_11]
MKKISFAERIKSLEMPHPLVILVGLVALSALATYILPGGSYDRIEKDGRLIAVAGSYKMFAGKPQGAGALAVAPFAGMIQAAEIIFLIFIIGGAFAILRATGALTAAITRATSAMKGREHLMIPFMMSVFGLAGGMFGMYEEVLPFVALIVPMAIAMGYDSIVGVCMVYLSTTLGFCGAFFNPFTIGIAQGIAGLPLFSGLGFRIVVWFVMVGTGILFVMRYGARIRRDPRKSLTYETDKLIREKFLGAGSGLSSADVKLGRKNIIILLLVAAGFAMLPVGVIHYKWGIKELTGLFLTIGAVCWIAGRIPVNRGAEAFIEGAREMMGAALLIGIARGVKIVL